MGRSIQLVARFLFANKIRNIIASYIYPANQAPRYWMACTVEGVALVCAMILTWTFRTILKRENKKMDQAEQADGGSNSGNFEKFRYIY